MRRLVDGGSWELTEAVLSGGRCLSLHASTTGLGSSADRAYLLARRGVV